MLVRYTCIWRYHITFNDNLLKDITSVMFIVLVVTCGRAMMTLLSLRYVLASLYFHEVLILLFYFLLMCRCQRLKLDNVVRPVVIYSSMLTSELRVYSCNVYTSDLP